MKKFLAITLATVMLLMLCACGGSGVVGKWQFGGGANTYEFKKDNTVSISIATILNYEGTYEVDGDKIIITIIDSVLMPGGRVFELAYSLDGDVLTLEGDTLFNGLSMKTDLTKVEK